MWRYIKFIVWHIWKNPAGKFPPCGRRCLEPSSLDRPRLSVVSVLVGIFTGRFACRCTFYPFSDDNSSAPAQNPFRWFSARLRSLAQSVARRTFKIEKSIGLHRGRDACAFARLTRQVTTAAAILGCRLRFYTTSPSWSARMECDFRGSTGRAKIDYFFNDYLRKTVFRLCRFR